MRIVYIGAVDFSRHCLETVIHNGGQVAGVVTTRDKGVNSDYCDLTECARRHHIPCLRCDNVNDRKTVEWIRALSPDIIFCWGFSQLIKPELLNLPPRGVIGTHPAALPENRGRHPLIWALALGLEESALTFFKMDEGVDSGPILSQQRFRISAEDDASSLYARIKELADSQIAQFLPRLADGTAVFIPQDPTRAVCWRKRSRLDGRIDWRMGTTAIVNLVRALAPPYPGAETVYCNQTVTVWKAEAHPGPTPLNAEPGKILDVLDRGPVIKCYDGAIVLTECTPQVDWRPGEYL